MQKKPSELSKANLNSSRNQLAANQALLRNVPLREQPQIQNAISSLKQAWLNLQRTKLEVQLMAM